MTDDGSAVPRLCERAKQALADLDKTVSGTGWYVEEIRRGHEDDARVYGHGAWGVCKPTGPNRGDYRTIAEWIAGSPSLVRDLLATVERLTQELDQLRQAISPTHGLTWSVGNLATLAEAHREDTEQLDRTEHGDNWGVSVDYDAVALARQSALTDLRRRLQTLEQEWRAKASHIDNVHSTMAIGWKTCADALRAALQPDPHA